MPTFLPSYSQHTQQGGLAHGAIGATLHPFEDAMSVVAIISFLKMPSFVFFYFV